MLVTPNVHPAATIAADEPQPITAHKTHSAGRLLKRQVKPIRYNELVGCIEVHTVCTQLRADYWFTDKTRIVIGSDTKGTIGWRGELLEKEYGHSSLTAQEIFRDFRDALERAIKHHPRLRRRHIDFEAFDRCGPFVDWRAALQLEVATT